MRIGLKEMMAFSKLLFPSVKYSTFFESCGVADLITTCSKDNDFQNRCLNPTFFFLLVILVELKQCYLWQWVEEIGKSLRLMQEMEERGLFFSILYTLLGWKVLKTRPKPTVQPIELELRVGFSCTIVW